MLIQVDSRLPEKVRMERPPHLPSHRLGMAGLELPPQSAGPSVDRSPQRRKPRPPPSRYGAIRSRSAASARIKAQSNGPCARTARTLKHREEDGVAVVVVRQVARRRGRLRTGGGRYACTNVDSDGARCRRQSDGSEGTEVDCRAVPWLP